MNDDWKQDPRERFIAQFEWDGAEALYRENRIGPAYRVTIDEYQGFIEGYDRRDRLRVWVAIAAILIIFATLWLVALFSTALKNGPPGTLELFAIAVPGLVVSWAVDRWLTRGPARALRLRTPASMALSGDERLRRTLGDRSWGSLVREVVAFSLMALWLIVMQTLFFSVPMGPAGWLLAALCLAALALPLAQMMRKWAFERRQRSVALAAS